MSDFKTIKFRIKLRRLLFLIIGWMIAGALISLYNYLLGKTDLFDPTEMYHFPRNLRINVMGGFLGGFFGGVILIFYLKDWFRKRSFAFIILTNIVVFLTIIIFVSVSVVAVLISSSMHLPLWDPEVLSRLMNYIFNVTILQTIFTWFLVTAATSFILQINDKFGIGVLRNHVFGKYHKPKEETRIFMFLDLKSSTTIAEKIGHVQYFNLLNDFFRDITDPIIYSNGEIYQYVGDEIVVSWKMGNGIEDANCLQCFFEIENRMNELAPVYQSKYGMTPEFKAGMHFGVVTTGEIGVVKKEVIFTGDVLNTTSRIQELCNHYKVNLITSHTLLDLLPIEGKFNFDEIGKIELRGKKKKVRLCAVTKSMLQH